MILLQAMRTNFLRKESEKNLFRDQAFDSYFFRMSDCPSENYPLPPDWEEYHDKESGSWYFFHPPSNATTWDHPGAWQECFDADKQEFFYQNKFTGNIDSLSSKELFYIEPLKTFEENHRKSTSNVHEKNINKINVNGSNILPMTKKELDGFHSEHRSHSVNIMKQKSDQAQTENYHSPIPMSPLLSPKAIGTKKKPLDLNEVSRQLQPCTAGTTNLETTDVSVGRNGKNTTLIRSEPKANEEISPVKVVKASTNVSFQKTTTGIASVNINPVASTNNLPKNRDQIATGSLDLQSSTFAENTEIPTGAISKSARKRKKKKAAQAALLALMERSALQEEEEEEEILFKPTIKPVVPGAIRKDVMDKKNEHLKNGIIQDPPKVKSLNLISEVKQENMMNSQTKKQVHSVNFKHTQPVVKNSSYQNDSDNFNKAQTMEQFIRRCRFPEEDEKRYINVLNANGYEMKFMKYLTLEKLKEYEFKDAHIQELLQVLRPLFDRKL